MADKERVEGKFFREENMKLHKKIDQLEAEINHIRTERYHVGYGACRREVVAPLKNKLDKLEAEVKRLEEKIKGDDIAHHGLIKLYDESQAEVNCGSGDDDCLSKEHGFGFCKLHLKAEVDELKESNKLIASIAKSRKQDTIEECAKVLRVDPQRLAHLINKETSHGR